MAYAMIGVLPVALVFGFLLGIWLKKHPGHPILQEIDDFVMQEAKMMALGKAAQVLAAKGITLPQQATAVSTASPTTTGPAAATK